MEQVDWEGFFACLAPDNLLRIAENSVGGFLIGGDSASRAFDTLCSNIGVPASTLAELRSLLNQISESAKSFQPRTNIFDPAKLLEDSQRHQLIVQRYQRTLKDMIQAVPDLARFTAGLERMLREESGGGSVSTRLFVGEQLENISIEGSKAWADRRITNGQSETVGFVKRKGSWYIHLFASRPRARK